MRLIKNTNVILRPYQEPVYEELCEKSDAHEIVCVAATTGFGKTELLAKFMEDRPTKRFLILAHGQTSLRKNFFDRLASNPALSPSLMELVPSGKASIRNKAKAANDFRIVVALPQSFHRTLEVMKDFDYLVVDEAHHFYAGVGSTWYQKILAWHGGRKQILLTASHYYLRNIPKVFFSREEALHAGQLADVSIALVPTSTKIETRDYTEDGDLKSEVKVQDSLGYILGLLSPGNMPLLIARHSQESADELGVYLKEHSSLRIAVSHAKVDSESEHLNGFKDGAYDVCVVVQRGSLGFDFTDLSTYVDATFTRSLTRLEQMLGRVSRQSKDGRKKRFIRLASAGRMEETELLTTAVLALGISEIYRTWEGVEGNIPLKKEAIPFYKEKSLPKEISDKPCPQVMREMTNFKQYLGLVSLEKVSFSSAQEYCSRLESNRSKRTLIEMAKNGEEKPHKNTVLGMRLLGYTAINKYGYDPDFAMEIIRYAADWFTGAKVERMIKDAWTRGIKTMTVKDFHDRHRAAKAGHSAYSKVLSRTERQRINREPSKERWEAR
jgi:superfamily II DNA or RNA helicase